MKIAYEYETTVYADIPAGGITVRYDGEAEITFLDRNEEKIDRIDILSVVVTVNGKNDPFASLPNERLAPFFYAKARNAARKAWVERRMEMQ